MRNFKLCFSLKYLLIAIASAITLIGGCFILYSFRNPNDQLLTTTDLIVWNSLFFIGITWFIYVLQLLMAYYNGKGMPLIKQIKRFTQYGIKISLGVFVIYVIVGVGTHTIFIKELGISSVALLVMCFGKYLCGLSSTE